MRYNTYMKDIYQMMSDHCATCGSLLIGLYYTIPGKDGHYCQRCIETRPRCDSCGAPVGQAHWQLHDGRLQCATCHATAIYDVSLAQTLYHETINNVATQLGLTIRMPVAFRLVDAPTLHALHVPSDNAYVPGHETVRPLGLYHRKGNVRVIYLLYGIPRLLFRITVAHEYAHAWQGEQCPMLETPMLREGFAEWVAFYHMLFLGATKAARRMIDIPHPYQPALEYMFELERRFGKHGLIQYIKQAR